MQVIIGFAACAWIGWGVLVFLMAKSAIHEILACLFVSFGILFCAIASIMGQLSRWQTAQDNAHASPAQPVPQPTHQQMGAGPLSGRLGR